MTERKNENGLLLIVGIIAFLVIFSLVSYFWLGPMIFTEQRDAGEDIVESTYDAENAVKTYEEFRTLHAEIEAQRNQVENSYDELDRFYNTYGEDPDEWDRTTKERHNRIQQRITGNQNQLENLVADYNAMSAQANNAIFKCNLPYQVDDQFYITGPPGSDSPDQPQDVGPDGEVIDSEPAPAEECNGLPKEAEA